MATGTLQVSTENIFPIIKKFLYSEQEIFLRELVSNAMDATTKVQKMAGLGEFKGELGELKVEVRIDKAAKTLTISDRGIGMSWEEVEKYINQVAFSSAEEFAKKFEKLEEGAQIIGHFGLGFYSAFMVADKVEILTKSWDDSAPAVKWSSTGSTEYEMDEAEKSDRGTDIVLHLNEDALEYTEEARVLGMLNKYCKFLPFPLKFGTETIKEKQDGSEEEVEVVKDRIINNTDPLWTKSPADLSDQDYLDFYQQLYPFSEPPLFWIHLNVDYPFNLTGILYFPKFKNTYEVQKDRIQLYCNQVFVTDSVEDIVPEYLNLLQGVIDSPDIPLNVSRSYLQGDPNVKKINGHISKKVADKLSELFKEDRKAYEEKWADIGIFVKYGLISDEKFYDRAKDIALYRNTEGEHFSTDEYKEKIKGLQTDKHNKIIVLYATNPEEQDSYIASARKRDYDVVVMDSIIDAHFVNAIEQKDEQLQFKRVDGDTLDKLVEKDEEPESVLSEDEQSKLKAVFEEKIGNQQVNVVLKALSPDDMPVYITKPEFMRRMQDMTNASGQNPFGGDSPDFFSLVINTNHELSGKILKAKGRKEDLVKQLYDLALLSQNMLKGSEMTKFINRSVDVLKN